MASFGRSQAGSTMPFVWPTLNRGGFFGETVKIHTLELARYNVKQQHD
jgi:hypothetical protein